MPKNYVLGIWVIVVIVQVLGKYMIIRTWTLGAKALGKPPTVTYSRHVTKPQSRTFDVLLQIIGT